MKRIILQACRHSKITSPLADKDNNIEASLSLVGNQLLVESLLLWQQEYNQLPMYSFWSLSHKVDFEREGLRLAQLLCTHLPREIDFSYYSKLYEQEIKFYQHE